MTEQAAMPTADSAMLARRALLAAAPNPGEHHEYMVMLEGSLALADQPVEAALCYVADRRVLSMDAFVAYLDAVAGAAWPTLEAVAEAMLADMNNELVPRWVQIRLVAGPGERGECHRVIIEDRQPGWDNPTLLARHGATWRR